MVVRRESTRGFGRREHRILPVVELIRREACNGLTAREAMKGIVGLEIMGRTGNETTQIAGQKQIGHDVAVVVSRLVGVAVAYGKRETNRPVRLRTLKGNLNLLVGIVGATLVIVGDDEVAVLVVMVDKEKSVGQYLPITIENGHVIYTRRQRRERKQQAIGSQ